MRGHLFLLVISYAISECSLDHHIVLEDYSSRREIIRRLTQEQEISLSAEETDKALSKMVKQGVTSQVKTTLTESVFLVGFALLLKAPNTVIGILAAYPL